MRIAYLVLAHGRPQQLARLVGALPSDSPLFIHFDRRADRGVFDEAKSAVLRANPRAVFVRRHRCRWGAPGIMYGTLELIEALCRSSEKFDYATLLSGQDYPIQTRAAIERDLARGGDFIECFSLIEPNRWSDHKGNFRATDRVFGRYIRFRSHIWRVGSRHLPDGIVPFGGSQWWTLSRNAIEYLRRVAHENRSLVRALGRSFIPDEIFVQTILGNSPLAGGIVQNDLRFAIWDRPEPPFPATLTSVDLPVLAASRKHFARKFDFGSAPDLANQIDSLRRPK